MGGVAKCPIIHGPGLFRLTFRNVVCYSALNLTPVFSDDLAMDLRVSGCRVCLGPGQCVGEYTVMENLSFRQGS